MSDKSRSMSTTSGQSGTSSSSMGDVVMEGWLLKKKRKKMQGFARRWFWLESSGLLCYSITQKTHTRDSLLISLSSIASNPRHRTIHIDSGATTYHIKALSEEDYGKWMKALRRFVHERENEEKGNNRKVAIGRGLLGQGKNGAAEGGGGLTQSHGTALNLSKSIETLKVMGDIINELDETLIQYGPTASKSNERRRSSTVSSNESKMEEAGSKFKQLLNKAKRESANARFLADKQAGTPEKGSTASSASVESGSTGKGSEINEDGLNRMAAMLTNLRYNRDRTLQLIQATVEGTIGPDIEDGYPEGDTTPTGGRSRSSSNVGPYGIASKIQHAFTGSRSSLDSAGGDNAVFFDAPSPGGAEEYFLEHGGSDSESSSDEGMGEIAEEDEDTEASSTSDGAKGGGTENLDKLDAGQGALKKDEIARRDKLPSPVTGDEGGMLSVLRKNVGKDLSTISFPISFNEPLNLLQKLAEDLEFSNLLDKAAECQDPVDRICYMTAFVVSTHSGTRGRSSRKPFNPLLGETFELDRPDRGFKFISEKVSHHPPLMAGHADGERWSIDMTASGKQKFWGRSLEYIPEGVTVVKLKSKSGEDRGEYTYTKPSTFVKNLMAGEKYVEFVGDVSVEASSGEKCTLSFKEGGGGMFGGGAGGRAGVEGVVKDKNGKEAAQLMGKWNEQFSRKLGADDYRILWKCPDLPKDSKKYYGFTEWAIQLNEITKNIEDKLPPFDSRYRPDQKMFEEGKLDEAEAKKQELENKQRQRRKKLEEKGEKYRAQWFEDQGKGKWAYNGKYWETRNKDGGEWQDLNIW